MAQSIEQQLSQLDGTVFLDGMGFGVLDPKMLLANGKSDIAWIQNGRPSQNYLSSAFLIPWALMGAPWASLGSLCSPGFSCAILGSTGLEMVLKLGENAKKLPNMLL